MFSPNPAFSCIFILVFYMRFFVTCDHVIVTFISFDTTDFLPSASEISLFLHSLDVPPRGNISVGNRADYFLIAHVKKCSEVSFVFLYWDFCFPSDSKQPYCCCLCYNYRQGKNLQNKHPVTLYNEWLLSLAFAEIYDIKGPLVWLLPLIVIKMVTLVI